MAAKIAAVRVAAGRQSMYLWQRASVKVGSRQVSRAPSVGVLLRLDIPFRGGIMSGGEEWAANEAPRTAAPVEFIGKLNGCNFNCEDRRQRRGVYVCEELGVGFTCVGCGVWGEDGWG